MESNWRMNVWRWGCEYLSSGPGQPLYPCDFGARLNPPLPPGVGVWDRVIRWRHPDGPYYLLCPSSVDDYADTFFNVGTLGGAHFPGGYTVDPD